MYAMKCEQLSTEQANNFKVTDETEQTDTTSTNGLITLQTTNISLESLQNYANDKDLPAPSTSRTIAEASASTDMSRGGSILVGTVSSSNGIKDVVAKYAFVGLQSAQGLAVGLSSAFIAVDLYQLFNATRNLNNGSMSETAKVLRMKADQLLEQQLFFNQIYEYLR